MSIFQTQPLQVLGNINLLHMRLGWRQRIDFSRESLFQSCALLLKKLQLHHPTFTLT